MAGEEDRRRKGSSRSSSDSEGQQEGKKGKCCLIFCCILFILLVIAIAVVLVLFSLTCLFGNCPLQPEGCYDCQYTENEDWRKYKESDGYSGKKELCEDPLEVQISDNSFTIDSSAKISGGKGDIDTASPLIHVRTERIGGKDKNTIELNWHMEKTVRNNDTLKLVFSDNGDRYAGLGDLGEAVFREKGPDDHYTLWTVEDDPFYLPFYLSRNQESSLCMFVDAAGAPIEVQMSGAMTEWLIYKLDEVYFHIFSASTPYEAIKLCMAMWRELYPSPDAQWTDDFILGSFTTNQINSMRQMTGALGTHFLLSPDSISIEEGDLKIQNEDEISDYDNVFLPWKARQNLEDSGFDLKSDNGYFETQEEGFYYMDYNNPTVTSDISSLISDQTTAGLILQNDYFQTDRSDEYTNLALNQKAEQQDSHEQGPASHAVDGNTNGDLNGNSVTQTLSDNGWWNVTLEEWSYVSYIDVYNRMDCCQERLKDAEVFLDEILIGSISQEAGTQKYTIPVNEYGKVVKIQAVAGEALNLAEVEVYGFSDNCPRHNYCTASNPVFYNWDSELCLGEMFGREHLFRKHNYYDLSRRSALQSASSMVVESVAAPGTAHFHRGDLELTVEGLKTCFHNILNLQMMGIRAVTCNMCGGLAPPASDVPKSNLCDRWSQLAFFMPYMMMNHQETPPEIREGENAGTYIKKNFDIRRQFQPYLEAAFRQALTDNVPFVYTVGTAYGSDIFTQNEKHVMIGEKLFFVVVLEEPAAGEDLKIAIPPGSWHNNGGPVNGEYVSGNQEVFQASTEMKDLIFFRIPSIFVMDDTANPNHVIVRIFVPYEAYQTIISHTHDYYEPRSRAKHSTTIECNTVDSGNTYISFTYSSPGEAVSQDIKISAIEVYVWFQNYDTSNSPAPTWVVYNAKRDNKFNVVFNYLDRESDLGTEAPSLFETWTQPFQDI